ncbi:MAG: oligosaccharide flippase family protein [Pseudomonadota bacterium]
MIAASARATAWAVPIAVEMTALVRSVILARLLGVEEFGQAALLAVTLRLVEMASDIGVERLLAQATDGDSAALQANLHGALILRGAAMALCLGVLAVVMSVAFPSGPALLTYLALALVPCGKAFLHLDVRRAERSFSYRGLALVEAAGAVAMLVVAALVAHHTGSHIALVFALAAQTVAQVVVSHLLAERRYRVSFERAAMLRIWAFGAPLIANAGLMFLTLQADRLIIAKAYGVDALAVFVIVLQLSLLPALITGRAAASLLAPVFRRAVDAGTVGRAAQQSLLAHAALAVVFFGGFVLLADVVVTVIYGAAFSPDAPIVVALAAAAALRIARTPLSQLAVSLGRTGDPARANVMRALVLLPVTALALTGAPLWTLVATAALGEALAALRGWQLLSDVFAKTPTQKVMS